MCLLKYDIYSFFQRNLILDRSSNNIEVTVWKYKSLIVRILDEIPLKMKAAIYKKQKAAFPVFQLALHFVFTRATEAEVKPRDLKVGLDETEFIPPWKCHLVMSGKKM